MTAEHGTASPPLATSRMRAAETVMQTVLVNPKEYELQRQIR